jgi:kynurenine formamidase
LTYALSETIPLPPGIPPMTLTVHSSIEQGDCSNVANICLCNHSGTHVDAPLHFARGGLALTGFDVNEFCFVRPILIDIPLGDSEMVTGEHLLPSAQRIRMADVLLIRTGFGRYRTTDPERYRLEGPGLSEEAAIYLAQEFPNLRCLGMDTISIVAMRHIDDGIKAHKALLTDSRRFLIIEDLNLDHDLSGITELIALPLLIDGIDGCPCTVIAR